MTLLVRVDPGDPEEDLIQQAASVIAGGGVVAFPTETVYGLGADAMSERAVRKIFEAKGRPADNPLIVHVAGRHMLPVVARNISRVAERLMEEFWPGPLTLVFERSPEVAPSVSAGLSTIAVRMPQSRVALGLISRAATPVAAPSANLSGRPSPTRAEHVLRDLDGRIDMIIDAGTTNIGIESTVLDMTGDPPILLRPGWITAEQIALAIGPVGRAASDEERRRSPGTRHRHYSPRARVILFERGGRDRIRARCLSLLDGERIGFIGHSEIGVQSERLIAVALEESAASYARSIYSALRELDEKGVDAIIIEGIDESGEGAAVMDRLRRAASEIV